MSSRISVLIYDGTNTWEKDFYDYATNHSEILAGFQASRTNLMLVTVYDKHRQSCTAAQLLDFVTGPLPPAFPVSTVRVSEPDKMEPGYTLFMVQCRSSNTNFITVVNNAGQVVWYAGAPSYLDDEVQQLDNGNFFIPDQLNRFVQINLLGQMVNSVSVPTGYPLDLHDGVPTSRGTILYISHTNRVVNQFPSSDTASNAPLVTATVQDCPVVEISATNGALLNVWSPFDILDPTRVTYLTYGSGSYNGGVVDNLHANAVLEDTNDNCIIESLRNQNAVIKFSRATGQLKWILGPPENWSTDFQPYLLTPVGTPFEWNYGQHAPEITPQGTLLVYDDGNYRADPFDTFLADSNNYSRGVEFNIDETNMEVSQVWDSLETNDDRLYTPIIGDADWLPQQRNVLVTYGYVTYINGVHPSAYSAGATMVRIKELTHDPVPEVVFDLSLFAPSNTSPSYLGYFVYRSHRITDLYSHPANPVADLTLSIQNHIPHLEFSADPVRTYVIESSTDLANWTTIGTALDEGDGTYDFDDLSAGLSAGQNRIYRIVTQ